MADFEIKQNDTWPPIGLITPVVLSDNNGPIDLTGATVKFLMRPADSQTIKVNSACVIVSAAAGTVRYNWSASDTDTAGEFVFEFQITFGDGKKATVPNRGYKELTIYDDIGD